MDSSAPSADSDHYKIVNSESDLDSLTWHEAREACQNLGDNWDLVIFNSRAEFDYVQSAITGNCKNYQSFWVGYKEQNGDARTIFKKSTPWDLPWADTEPNDNQGKEECVRMDKNGEMNDSICKRTWTGNQRDQVGMGYICENHPCKSL